MEKSFRKKLFGYHPDDVNAYIDHLVTEYDQLTHTRDLDKEAVRRETQSLKEELAQLKKENEALKKEKAAVGEALVKAQATAKEMVDKATEDCASIRKNFEEELDVLKIKKAEAEEKLASFQKEIQARIRNLSPHVDRLTEEE